MGDVVSGTPVHQRRRGLGENIEAPQLITYRLITYRSRPISTVFNHSIPNMTIMHTEMRDATKKFMSKNILFSSRQKATGLKEKLGLGAANWPKN
jgi:hypothetical protein